jgi:hypothetical protein
MTARWSNGLKWNCYFEQGRIIGGRDLNLGLQYETKIGA